MQALGVCTIFIGISCALKGMYRIENGVLGTSGAMLLIASLVICVGAMAIVGALEDGMREDYSMLAAKAVLDAVSALF